MYSVHNCQRQKQEFTKTGKISKMTQKGNIMYKYSRKRNVKVYNI